MKQGRSALLRRGQKRRKLSNSSFGVKAAAPTEGRIRIRRELDLNGRVVFKPVQEHKYVIKTILGRRTEIPLGHTK